MRLPALLRPQVNCLHHPLQLQPGFLRCACMCSNVGVAASLLQVECLGNPLQLQPHTLDNKAVQQNTCSKAVLPASLLPQVECLGNPLPDWHVSGGAYANGAADQKAFLHLLRRCDEGGCVELVRARTVWVPA